MNKLIRIDENYSSEDFERVIDDVFSEIVFDYRKAEKIMLRKLVNEMKNASVYLSWEGEILICISDLPPFSISIYEVIKEAINDKDNILEGDLLIDAKEELTKSLEIINKHIKKHNLVREEEEYMEQNND